MTPDRAEGARKVIVKGSEVRIPVGPRCRNCQKIVKDSDAPPGFCCLDCRTGFEGEVSQAALRKLVWARDRGVCALCAEDTKETQAVLNAFKGRALEGFIHGLIVRGYDRDRLEKKKSLWEADHISPQVKGGPTNIGNARTLCAPCHYMVSGELASSRGAARRKGRWGRG